LAGRAITISGRKYAAGLFWQPSGGGADPRENARRIARLAKMRAPFFISFNGMIGLSASNGGISSGMPVAAAEVMDSVGEHNFLAAFSVREGYWLLAVRGGIIVKDLFFPDKEGASKEFAELSAMPGWDAVLAPLDWNAEGSTERRVGEIVSGTRKHRLSNISNLSGYIMSLMLLAGAATAGYVFFEEPIKKMLAPKIEMEETGVDPEIIEEYRAGLEEIERPKQTPKKIVTPKMPWESVPSLRDKADQCWRATAFLAQRITGWTLVSVSCADEEATARLTRNYGTLDDLYNEVRRTMQTVKVNEIGGNDVVLTARLRPLEKFESKPESNADDVMTAMQSTFQRINADADFRRDFIELEMPALNDDEEIGVDMTDVPVVKIEAASKLQPLEFIKIMRDMSGVEMPKVFWDNANRTWTYDVVIFVK
jgi:hypothetical protein